MICPHCYPATPNHLSDKIESYFDYYLGSLLTLLPTTFFKGIGTALIYQVLDFSVLIKHADFCEEIERVQLNNGILVIWDEAKRRGLNIRNIKFGKKHTQYFVLYHQNKRYYFDRNPIYLLTQKKHAYDDATKYDNKYVFKQLLLEHQLPLAEGRAFSSLKKAYAYGLSLGFPLVVKPLVSSFSRHATFPIHTNQALTEALKIAREVNCRVIVERYIPGIVHRVTIIDKKIVAATKREAPSIIGRGNVTIEQLIDEKNNHPWRGAPVKLDCSLHSIEKNSSLRKILAKQNLNLQTKLKKGVKIFLADKMNSGSGADVTNVTALIHPDNEALFLKVHALLNIPLSGLDFICEDVSLPWHKQAFALIENNSLPYIDAHHFPSEGAPINVAAHLWEFVLANLTD